VSLKGKAAIVTGAGQGIGRAIALALAKAGADVTVVARTQSAIDRVAEECRGLGVRALPVAGDVSSEEAVKMVLHTCDRMAAGGMYDQLGGGFARYSVDEKWLVPHFEKMLYDNAQLIHLYLDAYLISGQARHADVARDIIRYVLRDMTHPEGGFYSAEDADSEGHEGKFYCWTQAEVEKLLTPEEAKVATRYFGITRDGNFLDHSHPSPLPNQNVLSVVDPKLSGTEAALLTAVKKKLFDTRVKRVRPHLDDKILASWNGLMLGAIARAGAVLGDEAYRQAAEKNLAFLRAKLWDEKTKTLYHQGTDEERLPGNGPDQLGTGIGAL